MASGAIQKRREQDGSDAPPAFPDRHCDPPRARHGYRYQRHDFLTLVGRDFTIGLRRA